MEYIDNLKQSWKDFIKSLVGIKQQAAMDQSIYIQEEMSHKTAIELYNRIYIGSVYELEQLIKQIPSVSKYNFYKMKVGNMERIHNTLPADTINMLVNVVINDFIDFEVEEEYKEVIKEIIKENDLVETLEDIVKKILIEGDGALVGNYIEGSNIPIIKFYSANEIEIIKENKKFKELIVKHKKKIGDKDYFIFEEYGYGYIRYKATDAGGKEISREKFILIDPTFPEEDAKFDDNLCLATPLHFFNSSKFEGRGKSILEGKDGAVYFLDQVTSIFNAELQPTRTFLGVNQDLLPRNKKGEIIRNNILENIFIMMRNSGMGSNQDIFAFNSDLKAGAYNTAELTAKLLFLQGIASPSSLGLDTKSVDESGVSQKEKEKQTRFTVNAIEVGLNNCYSTLLKMCIYSYLIRSGNKTDINKINVNMTFNQFGAADWGQIAEETGKAKQLGVISIYQSVKRVNPDWTEEEIEEEVKRIREDSGALIEDPFEKYTEDEEDEGILNLEKEEEETTE